LYTEKAILMEAPANETPSIKAPRSLVIIHTVFLEIGLVALWSMKSKEDLGLPFHMGGLLSLIFIVAWLLSWLLRRTRVADSALRISTLLALGMLPLSYPIWFVGTSIRDLLYLAYENYLIFGRGMGGS
jgi:ABC-type polysaccharide/polyol phosphate export permease